MRSPEFVFTAAPFVHGILLLQLFAEAYSLQCSQAQHLQRPIARERPDQIMDFNKYLQEEAERKEALEEARNPGRSIFTPNNTIHATSQQHLSRSNTVFALLIENSRRRGQALLKICSSGSCHTLGTTIDFDTIAPEEHELLTQSQQSRPLYSHRPFPAFSHMMHYIVSFSYDKKTCALYKWHWLITSSKNRFIPVQAPKGQTFVAYNFFCDDTVVEFHLDDGTTVLHQIIDSQRKEEKDRQEEENKKFAAEMSSLHKLELPQLGAQLDVDMQKQNCIVEKRKILFPWHGKTITYHPRFTRHKSWWYAKNNPRPDIRGYVLELLCDIGLLKKANSISIQLYLQDMGILQQINHRDITDCTVIIGNPFLLYLQTADNLGHIAILQRNQLLQANKPNGATEVSSLFPIVSGITAFVRGPKDYIIVYKDSMWTIIKLGEPTCFCTPSSPASSTSISTTSSPDSTPKTFDGPSRYEAQTSGSTSSATAPCAPSITTVTLWHKQPYIVPLPEYNRRSLQPWHT